ncbi:MAG: NOP5/NOP56 family protein [Candidatus Diapherotrites archaeon]|nr:NOP5/NOP56 family protein [Candidatus Diapherotrites archaeon]
MSHDLGALRQELIKQASENVRTAYSSKEIHVIKAVNLVEELDQMFNTLAEHCIEWHGFHFPELFYIIASNDTYLELILLGNRKNFSESKMKDLGLDKDVSGKILEKSKESIGSEFTEQEFKQLHGVASSALQLKKNRANLAEFIESSMKELAPNFSKLCGEMLSAKFLAGAGSLQKLASFPSSTIQVLGAEKALFAHLKSGSQSPKYGFLYNHSLVKQAKPWVRGRMARHLAGKLSIALRADVFGSKRNFADEFQKGLDAKLQELNKLPPTPKQGQNFGRGRGQSRGHNQGKFQDRGQGQSQDRGQGRGEGRGESQSKFSNEKFVRHNKSY